jgi:hypothetical protein
MNKKMNQAKSYENAAGEPDATKISNALRALEAELIANKNDLDKEVERAGNRASKDLKKKAIDAKYRLEYV